MSKQPAPQEWLEHVAKLYTQGGVTCRACGIGRGAKTKRGVAHVRPVPLNRNPEDHELANWELRCTQCYPLLPGLEKPARPKSPDPATQTAPAELAAERPEGMRGRKTWAK